METARSTAMNYWSNRPIFTYSDSITCNMADWDAFQADTLDILRQYDGHFDFFERVGSIEDSRPDCLCRVTREDKKEIWIVDAKNKESIGSEDRKRLEKYRSKIKSNPVEVGLDYSEISDHTIRIITVMNDNTDKSELETVKISSLHQFLQRELIYTDTSRVVRDISKMMKKGELSQNEARILYESVEPYRETVEAAIGSLEELEEEFSHLEVYLGERADQYDVPIDCVVKHEERGRTFLIDIPYSRTALERIDEKIETLKGKFGSQESDVYYSVISLFGDDNKNLVYSPEQIRTVIKRKTGIISARDVLGLFEPKIPVQTKINGGRGVMESEGGVRYCAEVSINKDYEVDMKVRIPEEAQKSLKNHFLNSRNQFGNLGSSEYRLKFEVKPGHRIERIEGINDLESLRKAVSKSFSSAVNPVLSQRFNTTADKSGIN